MKKIYIQLLVFSGLLFPLFSAAQMASTFEDIPLDSKGFYNGSDFKGGFKSANAFYTNSFDTTWGPYWEGFAVSSVQNDSDGTYNNQYAAITGGGMNSSKYGLCYSNGIIRLDSTVSGQALQGIYITNSTYAYHDMKLGSAFSKKFGGSTGTDPDFFCVLFEGWKNGIKKDTVVRAYLADYRFTNDSLDYLLKSWKYVSLNALGKVDSLMLSFESSDTGSFGINTPAYVCIDNFNSSTTGIASEIGTLPFRVYPNPAHDRMYVDAPANVIRLHLINSMGQEVAASDEPALSVEGLPAGIYFLRIVSDAGEGIQKIVVQ